MWSGVPSAWVIQWGVGGSPATGSATVTKGGESKKDGKKERISPDAQQWKNRKLTVQFWWCGYKKVWKNKQHAHPVKTHSTGDSMHTTLISDITHTQIFSDVTHTHRSSVMSHTHRSSVMSHTHNSAVTHTGNSSMTSHTGQLFSDTTYMTTLQWHHTQDNSSVTSHTWQLFSDIHITTLQWHHT